MRRTQATTTQVVAPLEGPIGAESEALVLPAGEAGLSAPQARILDTLRTVVEPSDSTNESGSEQVAVLPGQRSLGLPGVPEQFDLFDNLGYAIPSEVAHQDEPPRRGGDPSQLAWHFPVGGVQLGFEDWHRERDRALHQLADAHPRGKLRRAFHKVATRGETCGDLVRMRVCSHGHVENKQYVASQCDTRTCPASARAHALELRTKLFAAVKHWPTKREGASWFFHTVTVRCPPFVSVERLRVDRKRAFAGWKAGWHYIRKVCGGERSIAHLEVGTGGMVHVHVLAYHRFISPYQLEQVRAEILGEIGGGTTQYRVERVGTGKGTKGAVKEVAKYVCKGVAMNKGATQTHPMLAALIEVAFRSLPLTIQYGNWDGFDVDLVDNEGDEHWQCPTCGDLSYRWRYHDKRTGIWGDTDPRPPPMREDTS